jgi:hypothetical protein
VSEYNCPKCREPLALEHVVSAEAKPELNRLEFVVSCPCEPDSGAMTVRFRYNVRALKGIFGDIPRFPWKNMIHFVHNVDEVFADELRQFAADMDSLTTPEQFLAKCGGPPDPVG